jgi:hypothetical protein
MHYYPRAVMMNLLLVIGQSYQVAKKDCYSKEVAHSCPELVRLSYWVMGNYYPKEVIQPHLLATDP